MQRDVSFQLEEAVEIPDWSEAYPEHKFTVYKCCFLSTKPNSHQIPITDAILREYSKTILGNFLVGKIEGFDLTTHRKDESIMGFFPIEQEIEFVEENGVTKAYAYAVVSRRYAEQFNGIFEMDNFRNSSVEMTVKFTDETETEVESIDIYSLCVLGKRVNGSCPDANIKMVRFSQKKAEAYFAKNDNLNALKHFAQERKQSMADKTYKIDKSKEAMSETPWGDIDKTELRDKIVEADNKAELVKACYMIVEDGWEEAPSEHLKYPVMEIKGDTLVYNRYGLASALAYAKQEEETTVIDKVEAIYKDLDLDDSDGKEDKKMSEIEFSAVDIGNLWDYVWNHIRETHHWDYCIRGIYEQDNQKFAILKDEAQKLYRLDFSLTEEGFTAADEVVEVKEEFVETDEIKKFAEVEDAELMNKYTQFEEEHCDEHGDDCDCPECQMKKMAEKMAQLEKDIEDRDNIIMEKDALIKELEDFKAVVETKEKAMSVEAIMAEVKDCLSETEFTQYREAGLACEMSKLDAWSNSVKAVAFSELKKIPAKKAESGVFTFAAPVKMNEAEPTDIWERLKNKH